MLLFWFTSPLFAPAIDRLDARDFRTRQAAHDALRRAGAWAYFALDPPDAGRNAEYELRLRRLRQAVERRWAWHLSLEYAPYPPLWDDMADPEAHQQLADSLWDRLCAWDYEICRKFYVIGGPRWATYRLMTRLWIADQIAAGQTAEAIRADLRRMEAANDRYDRWVGAQRRPGPD
jgi:hypothetical protein